MLSDLFGNHDIEALQSLYDFFKEVIELFRVLAFTFLFCKHYYHIKMFTNLV